MPVDGESDQVTEVLDVPLTAAVNCCVPPGLSVTLEGVTETATPVAGLTLIVAVFVTDPSDAETCTVVEDVAALICAEN